MDLNDRQVSQKLLQGDITMYEWVYKNYFKPLYIYAYTIVKDEVQAEEIVQNLFLKIWEKKEKINIESSLKAYLYKAIYFDSLNHLKHLDVKANYEQHAVQAMKNTKTESPVHTLSYKNLEHNLRAALNELPEQCRTVFQMSRFEELKYRQIAHRLGISEKTVESHMGKALRILRLKLADFIISVAAIIIYFKTWEI